MELSDLNLIYAVTPMVLGAGLLAFISVLWRLRAEQSINNILLLVLLLVLLLTFMVPTWDIYALHILKLANLSINSWHAHALSWLGGPLIYVIVKAAIFPHINIFRYWPHTLPCIGFSLYFGWISHLPIFSNVTDIQIIRMFAILWVVMMSSYTLAAARIILIFKRKRMNYTSADMKIGEKRAVGLLVGYTAFILADIAMAFYYLNYGYVPVSFDVFFQLSRLAYITLLIGILQHTDVAKTPSFEHLKQEVAGKGEIRVSDDVAVKIAELLDKKVNEEKIFLEPDIGLQNLAERIGVSAHNLSAVLNNHIKTSFYLYINQRRIMYAKQLLAETDDFITDIAINSGFSSRSSFYSMFKKCSGITPKQYREEIKKHTVI